MTPYELVKSKYALPFELYPYQQDTVNELAPLPRAGFWLDMGAGKTIVSIVCCLYKLMQGEVQHVIVAMPPILLVGWSRVLNKIPGVTNLIYRGSPKQREAMVMDSMFILMSYQILKKDMARLNEEFADKTIAVIADESTAVKNVGSDTYKKVRDLALGQHLLLLSGSPLSTPHDGYAPIKLVSPSIYRTLAQYEMIHVAKRDFFKQVMEWQNLDLLASNLLVNSVRILKEDVIKDMPPITYAPIFYELDRAHLKTYKTLCDQQMLKFANGEKLDATNASALFNALQQIISNREHFTQEAGTLSRSIEVVHELMDELGDGKLVIFTNFRMTNRLLAVELAKYNVASVFGEVSQKEKDRALDRFRDDPSCRVLVLQSRSGSYGIDGCQAVCSTCLFLEMPYVPAIFHQAVARLHRVGQTRPVTAHVAIADRTIQTRLWDVLQDKDTLVNMCIRGVEDIRDALSGETKAVQNRVICA
jgi:SNF2 family DNA or RNA helicase